MYAYNTAEFIDKGGIKGMEALVRVELETADTHTKKLSAWRDLVTLLWFRDVPSRIEDLQYLCTKDDGRTNYINTSTGEVIVRLHKNKYFVGDFKRKVGMDLCNEIVKLMKYRDTEEPSSQTKGFVMTSTTKNGKSGDADEDQVISTPAMTTAFTRLFSMPNTLYRKYQASMATDRSDLDSIMATVIKSASDESHSVGTHKTYYLKPISAEDRAKWAASTTGQPVAEEQKHLPLIHPTPYPVAVQDPPPPPPVVQPTAPQDPDYATDETSSTDGDADTEDDEEGDYDNAEESHEV